MQQTQAEVALAAADGDPNVAIEILMSQQVCTDIVFKLIVQCSVTPSDVTFFCRYCGNIPGLGISHTILYRSERSYRASYLLLIWRLGSGCGWIVDFVEEILVTEWFSENVPLIMQFV